MDLIKVNNDSDVLSYESFIQRLEELSKPENNLEKIADKVSEIPSSLKLLTRFDPTGITGDIISLLEDNKAIREKEAINRALYALYAGIVNNKIQIENIRNDKANILTEQYFEEVKKVETEKIEYLRNAYIFGLENAESTLSEDKNIISIISSLTINEINILVYSVRKLRMFSHKEQRESIESGKRITLEEVIKNIGLSEERAIQSCMSLIGRGLFEDWGVGRFDYNGPRNYIINDYTKLIIDYAIGNFA
jgi:Asp-tRNA(Asn)/Glu-tRNA(Gln) amidotransferase C subunit